MTKRVLHAEETGSGGEGTWVFLHGFMGSGRSFRPVIAALAPTRRCIAFDLPGHGRSLFGRNARLRRLGSFEETAALLLEELAARGADRFTLYGYSLGGRIAQAVALAAPDRVERLILESASFGIGDPALREERLLRDRQLLAAVRSREEFAAFLERWYRLPLFRTLQGTPLLAELLRERATNSVAELRRALDLLGVGNHPFFAERLAGLPLPIHYFFGERDAAYAETARAVRLRLPGLILREFPGASHDIHSQFPDRIAAALLEIGRTAADR